MRLADLFYNLAQAGPLFRGAVARGNLNVLASMLGPAWRGMIVQQAKREGRSDLRVGYDVRFDWDYERGMPELRRLYEAAKRSQWNASTDIDWSHEIDPGEDGSELLPDDFLPVSSLDMWPKLTAAQQREQRRALLSWMMSQFLHGEQGALMAACQVTESVPWTDAKLYGSSQVVDEGRHVEVFHTYLDDKLGKRYEINDNLYVIIDSLMLSESWDLKFLGMQILIEGLALGAFGTIRNITREPLLREILRYVITDEARHVHFGVVSLGKEFKEGLSEAERRYREDWTLEVVVQLRDRFLAHEFYEEYYAPHMSRREWDELVANSPLMSFFRKTMFKRIMPNLKRLGLVTERVRPWYEHFGLLQWESGKSASELSAREMMQEDAAAA